MPMSIANLPDGVGGPGRTQYFNFQYDDSLSDARGRALAADLMNYCDDDLALLSAWFSGRQLDMSPPITVSLVSARKDAAGNPIEALGASWIGLLAWPLQVTIKIDEFPLTSGTPTMLARCLLVAEVSEMYMRAFYAHFAPNPWFRTLEGNKGEGLSRFLSVQFLLRKYPGVTEIPMLMLPSRRRRAFNVTQLWLNSPRDNWLEVNEDDNRPSPVVGCATLFLFYLHDQLGFRIEDIINAGAGHLSNVYENLTHDSALNAWKNFSGLVNSHYPHGGGPITFTPAYNPPLETLFPVSDLKAFSATLEVSWEPALTQPVVVAGVDHPPKLPLPIRIKSSNPGIIPPPSVTISPSTTTDIEPMTVVAQGASFNHKLVTLTASYAGRVLTTDVKVVTPDVIFPSLEIDVDRSEDPCQPLFIEGASQIFKINNLFVFPDQAGLSYSWSVNGAKPGATDEPTLTIAKLPPAGRKVRVRVTVTNQQSVKVEGTLSFTSVALDWKALDKELRCRLSRFRNLTVSIPEWTSIEHADVREEQLKVLQEELFSASEAVESVKSVIERMNEPLLEDATR